MLVDVLGANYSYRLMVYVLLKHIPNFAIGQFENKDKRSIYSGKPAFGRANDIFLLKLIGKRPLCPAKDIGIF